MEEKKEDTKKGSRKRGLDVDAVKEMRKVHHKEFWDYSLAKGNKVDVSKLSGGWKSMGISKEKIYWLLADFERLGLVKENGRLLEPYMNPLGFNIKQVRFIIAYTRSFSDTYLSARKSAVFAGYDQDEGTHLLNNPVINMALRELLNTAEIDGKIADGVKHRLNDPDSKNWISTADFVAKVRGDYAPERHEVMGLSAEEREKQYQDVLNKVRGAQGVIVQQETAKIENVVYRSNTEELEANVSRDNSGEV